MLSFSSVVIAQALAVACGKLHPNYLPKLGATRPVCDIGPFPAWWDPSKIGTMDPWGHLVTDVSERSGWGGAERVRNMWVSCASFDVVVVVRRSVPLTIFPLSLRSSGNSLSVLLNFFIYKP